MKLSFFHAFLPRFVVRAIYLFSCCSSNSWVRELPSGPEICKGEEHLIFYIGDYFTSEFWVWEVYEVYPELGELVQYEIPTRFLELWRVQHQTKTARQATCTSSSLHSYYEYLHCSHPHSHELLTPPIGWKTIQNILYLIHSILGLSSSSVSSSCSSSDSSSMVTPCPGLNHFSLVSTSTFSRLGRGDTPWRSRRLEGVGADAAASTWSTLKLGRSNSLGSDVPVDQLARAASSISSHCCKMIAWASSRERKIKFLKQSKSALTRLHKLQQPKKKLQECIASNSTSSDKSSVRDWPSNFVKAAAADCKSMAPTDQIETMNPETPKSVAQSTWQTRKKKTISDDSWSPFSWHTSVVWVVIDDMDPISFALKHVRCFQHTKEKWECEKTKLEISCNINNLLCCFSNRSLMQADTIFFLQIESFWAKMWLLMPNIMP